MHFEKSSVPSPSPIRLKQKGENHVVRLKQKTPDQGITINLNWRTRADLDLGCFYELRPEAGRGGFFASLTGSRGAPTKSVIDGLQFSRGRGGPRDRATAQGCYSQRPFIWHSGDDRSGAENAEGESILVNPEGGDHLLRMTLYAVIYEGVARWDQTDAVVTVRVPGNADVRVEMGREMSPEPFVAIAGLDFETGGAIRVSRLVTFHADHGGCDRAYGWGLRWQSGSK